MAKKELLQGNKVGATLFVGVGGIGSRIIKGVADRCINDVVDNIRFVVMDTDVNDLTRLENGSVITTIQTSSTRTIKDYLAYDKDAKDNWFPVNKILDYKTVSEGAGQVRAISRLALDATIRQGNINKLYKAIDDLYLKDGSDKNQAIKVVIASSLTGGTGSGIALPIAMLIRNYINKNYPESSSIIRGFFIMPGVMDTVITTESERLSQRRNGYAALKEINAFMMKGSGFFDSDTKLHRYRDLGIRVPSTSGEDEDLDSLPFDFCFLLDRIDEKQRSMERLDQYQEFAAQSIYEQNIGPMNKSASSKEDNIVKEFIVPEKHGRCRFGGAGASVLKYPYEDIRDYVALNWTQRSILGAATDDATDEERALVVKNSWLRYDAQFKEEVKKYERNPNATAKDEPVLAETYMSAIENIGEAGDNFTNEIKDKYLLAKAVELGDGVAESASLDKKMEKIATDFINTVVNEGVYNHLESRYEVDSSEAKYDAGEDGFMLRFNRIRGLEDISDSGMIEEIIRKFVAAAFSNDTSIKRNIKDPYTLEAYLSAGNTIMHPNAARYLLYKLAKVMKIEAENTAYNREKYEETLDEIKYGETDEKGKRNVKKFKVAFDFDKERSLEDMCDSCDDANIVTKAMETVTRKDPREACNELLTEYYNHVTGYYKKVTKHVVCEVGYTYVMNLLKSYENFFNSFDTKVISLEKEKKNIVGKLRFNNGDCVKNLFGSKEYLDTLVSLLGAPLGNNADNRELFGNIYDTVKNNARIDERNRFNPMNHEVKKDIFDEIIIEHYKHLVENNCDEEIDRDILQAIRLEYEIKCNIDLAKASTEEERERISKRANDISQIKQYIRKTIDTCRNLASPGISRQDFEESRDVSAIAFGVNVKDANGIRVADYLEEKNQSPTIPKNELHFFSSIYNIMPTQIAKLCFGKSADREAETFNTHSEGSGDYFIAYQDYMEKIGPDSRINPIITPHIDKRWNSISVMPELDLDFQSALIKHIHQALVYGILYKIISRHAPSKYDPDTKVYRYTDGRNGFKEFIVSNGTICDEFYEVADALYFDRAAVTSIHRAVESYREEDMERSISYEKSRFARSIKELDRSEIFDLPEGEEGDELRKRSVSIFETPLMYAKSVPPRKKDNAEIDNMVEAIIEIVFKEVSTFCDGPDIKPLLQKLILKHFSLLLDNYRACPSFFGNGIAIEENDVIQIVRKKIMEKFEDMDIFVNEEKLEVR